MRILFVGTVEFSRHCLEELLDHAAPHDGQVVAVLTLDPAQANGHADYTDLAHVIDGQSIPLHRIRDINAPHAVELIRSYTPDVLCVFGWSQLISKTVLEIPPLGCIGAHPALLPHHRGRHPIIWALVEGLSESGLTFFYLDERADHGDILWQRAFPITLQDDAASVYARVTSLAREAIREFLPQLAQGTAPRRPQDHRQATYWRKRHAQDGEISWEAPTLHSYNLIRALAHPYVGAHTSYQGQRLRVWRSALPDGPLPDGAERLVPGTVLLAGGKGLVVRTNDGYLRLVDYELPSGGPVPCGAQLGVRG